MSESINFEKHMKEAYSWLNEISKNTGTPDRTDWAYRALKSVLHTIRDRTTLEEAFQLSAQLPVFIRGVYFEGYKPGNKPDKMHSDEFLWEIRNKMSPDDTIEPEMVFKVVLEILYNHVSSGELTDIRGTMPKDIQKLWDHSLKNETARNII